MSVSDTDKRIKKLELELKNLRQELQSLRERIDDLGKHHDPFGPIKIWEKESSLQPGIEAQPDPLKKWWRKE